MEKTYIAIDLKSFYASVECNERNLDPLTTNLVVADASRTQKTICLAVSPSLKSYGIPGRARLFEVVQKVSQVNKARRYANGDREFTDKSSDAIALKQDPSLELDYVVATPRMALYMEYSTKIYQIYLKYVAPEDIHVYSIDEVFMDVSGYLRTYNMTAHQLAMKIIREVLETTGITATAGIAPNLFLCKVAMDVVAKHIPADKDGVRIAEIDEISYRQLLWAHQPLTDFWRIGGGIARKLNKVGIFTMGDIARASVDDEDMLYKMFGINAETLIDHAWGYEPATIAEIKSYVPENNSLSSGQVLPEPYDFDGGRLIAREMTDLLVLDLVDKHLKCDQMVLTVGYDMKDMEEPKIRAAYKGEYAVDYYGRYMPKMSHGSINLDHMTSSTQQITEAVMKLYDQIVNPILHVRRMYVVANHVLHESKVKDEPVEFQQMDLFTDYAALAKEKEEQKAEEEREHQAQEAILKIQKKYGKNALIKGMNMLEGGRTVERNAQIGGHKA